MMTSAQHQHLMSLYNLPAHDEPRPMCGQGLITKLLKKNELPKHNFPMEQGLFSMELAADTESDGGTSSSVPKFIMRMDSEEKRKQRRQLELKAEKNGRDSPCSRTSLTTEDLAQLSSNTPPNSESSSSKKDDTNGRPLRVCVTETTTGIEVPCALGDNLSSHGSMDTTDSLVSNLKSLLEEQQNALVQMAEQNRQFKETLISYNDEISQLREEKAEQKIRMAQLVLQNETFETQSVVLRSEIASLKSLLDERHDDELRRRFESLLDEDSVGNQELEDKILGASSFESLEDDLLKLSDLHTNPSKQQPDAEPDVPLSPMANVTENLQRALSHFDSTIAETVPSRNRLPSHRVIQQPSNPRTQPPIKVTSQQPSNPSDSRQVLYDKARRALSRQVAAESPRAALAPRSTGENNQIQRQPSGVIESIEVKLDDDQETVFTAMSTISGEIKKKNSADAYKNRLGEIRKKRQERSSLPAVFEKEIGKKYEA